MQPAVGGAKNTLMISTPKADCYKVAPRQPHAHAPLPLPAPCHATCRAQKYLDWSPSPVMLVMPTWDDLQELEECRVKVCAVRGQKS